MGKKRKIMKVRKCDKSQKRDNFYILNNSIFCGFKKNKKKK